MKITLPLSDLRNVFKRYGVVVAYLFGSQAHGTALGGSFTLISGSAALIAGTQEQIVTLPNFYWQGVIIAYRIPRPTKLVDITPFLE
ncbi:MAG: hypothetical protein ACD_72C00019G0001 [uncultured bacterium]|nr:MAG: hypothetical protein ACD_72C00019G0001 [uncultured bacterium]